MFAGAEDRERGHKLEKARKWIFPLKLARKEHRKTCVALLTSRIIR